MICKQCKRGNPEGNNFCAYCGAKLEKDEKKKKMQNKKHSRWKGILLGGMCGIVLLILIIVIVMNSSSTSGSPNEDEDNLTNNSYTGGSITLDNGKSISSGEVYILSGLDGSVDEETTIDDIYSLCQSNPVAGETKLEDKYVIVCDVVSSVSKNDDGGLWVYTENGTAISFGFEEDDSESRSFASEITPGDIIAACNYKFQCKYIGKSSQDLEWDYGEGELAGKLVLKSDSEGTLWKSDR